MAETDDVAWVVTQTDELAQLQQQLDSIDAVIEETWPAGVNAGIVALVRTGDADGATDALGAGTSVFDGEADAREAAQQLAASGGADT